MVTSENSVDKRTIITPLFSPMSNEPGNNKTALAVRQALQMIITT